VDGNGAVNISDTLIVLKKTGKLNAQEWITMKTQKRPYKED
jgi:response regulator RpfG family c-di-GMP phosphodiesterase